MAPVGGARPLPQAPQSSVGLFHPAKRRGRIMGLPKASHSRKRSHDRLRPSQRKHFSPRWPAALSVITSPSDMQIGHIGSVGGSLGRLGTTREI